MRTGSTPAARRDPVDDVYRDLVREFGHAIPHGTLRRFANDAVAGLDGARVRDFVSMLAWRRARRRAALALAAPEPDSLSA